MLLFLIPVALLIQQPQLGTFDDPNTGLKSAGIRGTIDPGGYSASAETKSRTEFFQLLADLQVSALRPLWNHARRSDQPAIEAMQHGDFTRAVALLQELVASQNDYCNHDLLGLAYEGDGQLAAAAEQFRAAAVSSPDNSSFFAQGVALLLAGDLGSAETVFSRAAKGPGSTGLFGRLGIAATQFQRGQIREALNGFIDAAVSAPDATAPFAFLAITMHAADPAGVARCITVLKSLLRTSPQNAWAHYALSRALVAQGDPVDRIEDELKAAIQLDPSLAEAHFQLAEIYAQNGSLSTAISEYQAALKCAGPWPEAHYRLAQLYERSGQPALAKQEFELHRETQAQQKRQIESGRVPIRLREDESSEKDESK